MDFYQIRVHETKEGQLELYPDFIVGRSEDLMVQGRTFYAIWDEEKGLWSRDEYDVQRLVDEDLRQEADRLKKETGATYQIRSMRSFGSNSWTQFRKFVAHISDNHHPLDSKLVFANSEVKKTDYASKRLPYSLVSFSMTTSPGAMYRIPDVVHQYKLPSDTRAPSWSGRHQATPMGKTRPIRRDCMFSK